MQDTRIVAQLGDSDLAALMYRTELFKQGYTQTSEGNERTVELNFTPEKVVYENHDTDGDMQVVGLHDETLVMLRYYRSSQSLWWTVAATDRAQVMRVYKEIDASRTPPKVEPDKVSISFWVMTKQGPECHVRDLECPLWEDVQANYDNNVINAYSRIIDLYDNDTAGNIIVWHGIPGTGKTSAIRSLMQSLKEVSEFHYIVDPERFYGDDPSYLIQVLLQARQTKEHRLFILEDTGEMLHKDAKDHVGQALSRLLNTADGLIGQGTGVKMLMTTNDSINELHPAIVRPGRCLSEVHFQALPVDQANAWLTKHGIDDHVTQPTTLGELYAMKGEYLQEEVEQELAPTGMYM